MTTQNTAPIDYIVTFSSSHLALKGENLLNRAGFHTRLIAAPRSISSECGFCLLLNNPESENLAGKLEELEVTFVGIYTKQQQNGVTQYEQQA